MSIATRPGYTQLIRTEMVTVPITTEAPVHVCDRCGTLAPRRVQTRPVETDRNWKVGEVLMESLPEGWARLDVGSGPKDALGNTKHQMGPVELCPPCQPIVAAAHEAFYEASGLLAGEATRRRLYQEAKAAEDARIEAETKRLMEASKNADPPIGHGG